LFVALGKRLILVYAIQTFHFSESTSMTEYMSVL